MKYAETIDGIPLIGVPFSATHERCDWCERTLFIARIEIIGLGRFLCRYCRIILKI